MDLMKKEKRKVVKILNISITNGIGSYNLLLDQTYPIKKIKVLSAGVVSTSKISLFKISFNNDILGQGNDLYL